MIVGSDSKLEFGVHLELCLYPMIEMGSIPSTNEEQRGILSVSQAAVMEVGLVSDLRALRSPPTCTPTIPASRF